MKIETERPAGDVIIKASDLKPGDVYDFPQYSSSGDAYLVLERGPFYVTLGGQADMILSVELKSARMGWMPTAGESTCRLLNATVTLSPQVKVKETE
jgi:hypothetical protein